MRGRVFLATILATLIVIVGFIASGTAGAAAPSTQKAPASPAATNPHMLNKQTLNELSIDGPALFESNGTPFDLIAWTGTDPAHHLNIIYTNTGFVHDRTKHILNETSFARPAIVVHGFGGPDPVLISIAWTGTDKQHTLNVLYDALGVRGEPKKLTLWGVNSFTAPSLVLSPTQANTLLLVWASTDANHTLNVMPITIGATLKAGPRTTLTTFHSAAGPNLVIDGTNSHLLLSWNTLDSQRIAFASSTDGKRFTASATSPLAEWTASTSSMIGTKALGAVIVPEPPFPGHFLAWTGTDARHSLNVQYTIAFPQWGNQTTTKTTFSERCFGGPAMAQSIGGWVVVAWTGTDPAHHINFAWVEV